MKSRYLFKKLSSTHWLGLMPIPQAAEAAKKVAPPTRHFRATEAAVVQHRALEAASDRPRALAVEAAPFQALEAAGAPFQASGAVGAPSSPPWEGVVEAAGRQKWASGEAEDRKALGVVGEHFHHSGAVEVVEAEVAALVYAPQESTLDFVQVLLAHCWASRHFFLVRLLVSLPRGD